MHGRLKVKTTAEKEAERQKERERKKLLYQGCMQKIRALYQSGDRSLALLKLIRNVLENLPEFGTLWNWRRHVLLSLFEIDKSHVINTSENVIGDAKCGQNEGEKKDQNTRENIENVGKCDQKVNGNSDDNSSKTDDKKEDNSAKVDKKEDNSAKVDLKEDNSAKVDKKEDNSAKELDKLKLIEEEKYFVSRCLEVNPKAYSLWAHRRWLVELHPTEAVLNTEIELCNLFLKYDERNFHCWDYRRFIVKTGGISRQSELDKTTSLIEKNFSNYSAWHYRSTLLETSREVVDAELEWTQNAYFTDPADQSVWLYHQWLLGRQQKRDGVLVACVERDSDCATLVVLLQNPVYHTPDVTVSCCARPVRWCCNVTPARLWYCDIPACDSEVVVRYKDSSVTVPARQHIGVRADTLVTPHTSYTAPTEIATEQLANIQELYTLEPDNKWCILALVNMLNVLHPRKTKEQITEIRNLTVRLCQVDPARTGYYRDLWSTILCQTAIETWWFNQHLDQDIAELSLSKKYLTCVVHTDYMFTLRSLNLAHNNISSFSPAFSSLLALQKLDISHNKITTLQGIEHCKQLADLDVSHNCIANTNSILPGTKCRIKVLCLTGNPVTGSQVYPACVLDSFVMLCTLDEREL